MRLGHGRGLDIKSLTGGRLGGDSGAWEKSDAAVEKRGEAERVGDVVDKRSKNLNSSSLAQRGVAVVAEAVTLVWAGRDKSGE